MTEPTQHTESVRIGQLTVSHEIVYDARIGKWRIDEIDRMVVAICDTWDEADRYYIETTGHSYDDDAPIDGRDDA